MKRARETPPRESSRSETPTASTSSEPEPEEEEQLNTAAAAASAPDVDSMCEDEDAQIVMTNGRAHHSSSSSSPRGVNNEEDEEVKPLVALEKRVPGDAKASEDDDAADIEVGESPVATDSMEDDDALLEQQSQRSPSTSTSSDVGHSETDADGSDNVTNENTSESPDEIDRASTSSSKDDIPASSAASAKSATSSPMAAARPSSSSSSSSRRANAVPTPPCHGPEGDSALSTARSRAWTKEEDEYLARLVKRHGTGQWTLVSKLMEAVAKKNGKQCRERWCSILDPSIVKTPWTPLEDEVIERKVLEIGTHWKRIAPFLPGRPASSVKNRHYSLLRKNARSLRKKGLLPNIPAGAPAPTHAELARQMQELRLGLIANAAQKSLSMAAAASARSSGAETKDGEGDAGAGGAEGDAGGAGANGSAEGKESSSGLESGAAAQLSADNVAKSLKDMDLIPKEIVQALVGGTSASLALQNGITISEMAYLREATYLAGLAKAPRGRPRGSLSARHTRRPDQTGGAPYVSMGSRSYCLPMDNALSGIGNEHSDDSDDEDDDADGAEAEEGEEGDESSSPSASASASRATYVGRGITAKRLRPRPHRGNQATPLTAGASAEDEDGDSETDADVRPMKLRRKSSYPSYPRYSSSSSRDAPSPLTAYVFGASSSSSSSSSSRYARSYTPTHGNHPTRYYDTGNDSPTTSSRRHSGGSKSRYARHRRSPSRENGGGRFASSRRRRAGAGAGSSRYDDDTSHGHPRWRYSRGSAAGGAAPALTSNPSDEEHHFGDSRSSPKTAIASAARPASLLLLTEVAGGDGSGGGGGASDEQGGALTPRGGSQKSGGVDSSVVLALSSLKHVKSRPSPPLSPRGASPSPHMMATRTPVRTRARAKATEQDEVLDERMMASTAFPPPLPTPKQDDTSAKASYRTGGSGGNGGAVVGHKRMRFPSSNGPASRRSRVDSPSLLKKRRISSVLDVKPGVSVKLGVVELDGEEPSSDGTEEEVVEIGDMYGPKMNLSPDSSDHTPEGAIKTESPTPKSANNIPHLQLSLPSPSSKDAASTPSFSSPPDASSSTSTSSESSDDSSRSPAAATRGLSSMMPAPLLVRSASASTTIEGASPVPSPLMPNFGRRSRGGDPRRESVSSTATQLESRKSSLHAADVAGTPPESRSASPRSVSPLIPDPLPMTSTASQSRAAAAVQPLPPFLPLPLPLGVTSPSAPMSRLPSTVPLTPLPLPLLPPPSRLPALLPEPLASTRSPVLGSLGSNSNSGSPSGNLKSPSRKRQLMDALIRECGGSAKSAIALLKEYAATA